MNHANPFKKVISLFLVFLLVACAASGRRTDNPDRSRLGVLIIAGEGLNSTFDNPAVNKLLFSVSQKFAESARSEIEGRGTQASVFMNLDRNAKAPEYVSRLLSEKKRDALVQVSVTHVKNEKEESVYLEATYYALQWQADGKADNAVSVSGPTMRYKLLGEGPAGSDERNTSFETFAKSFAEKLYKEGYIGGA